MYSLSLSKGRSIKDTMTHKNFLTTTGIIFLVIALIHLLRIIMGWDVVIGDLEVPMWISWIALLVTGYLGYQGFALGKK